MDYLKYFQIPLSRKIQIIQYFDRVPSNFSLSRINHFHSIIQKFNANNVSSYRYLLQYVDIKKSLLQQDPNLHINYQSIKKDFKQNGWQKHYADIRGVLELITGELRVLIDAEMEQQIIFLYSAYNYTRTKIFFQYFNISHYPCLYDLCTLLDRTEFLHAIPTLKSIEKNNLNTKTFSRFRKYLGIPSNLKHLKSQVIIARCWRKYKKLQIIKATGFPLVIQYRIYRFLH